MGVVGLADIVDGALKPAVSITPYQKHARVTVTAAAIQEKYDEGESEALEFTWVDAVTDRSIVARTVSVVTVGDTFTPFTTPANISFVARYENDAGARMFNNQTFSSWIPSGSGDGLSYTSTGLNTIDYGDSGIVGQPVYLYIGSVSIDPVLNTSTTAYYLFDLYYTLI